MGVLLHPLASVEVSTNAVHSPNRAVPRIDASPMVDVHDVVESLGGFAQKKQLVRLGATDRALTAAVKSGVVMRVRNGWYSTKDAATVEVRAVRVGGRLTGLSAIAHLDGWVTSAPTLHVAVPRNAARLRTPHNRRRRFDVLRPGSTVVHWEPPQQRDRGTTTVVALVDALHRVILDEKLEDAIAALDWALHFALIDEGDLDQLMLRIPEDLRWVAEWTDAACESLPESLSRTRFRLRGHAVRTQVRLTSNERIDVLVDEAIAVEVDGRMHHSESFLTDRAKDLRITIAGYHALRPAASMVFRNWDDVYLAVTVALAERGRRLPERVGNSGKGRLGPASRSEFVSRRAPQRRRFPEFPTERVLAGGPGGRGVDHGG